MNKQNGFTLVELLVVIFIISILTGIGLVSFSGAQKQARDTTRRSDLGQYRNALENYAANNSGSYPLKTSGGLLTAVWTESLQSYMSQSLEDPKFVTDPTKYRYVSNGDLATSVPATGYIVYATLETTTDKWYMCSNGKNGKAVSPTLTTCGISSP